MLKAIIADDELYARENLQDMLANYCPDITVVGVCPDIPATLQCINDFPSFDVLFLDINFGKDTGFDLLARLGPKRSFQVVIITAYEQYALKAFNEDAVDYLLKPISREALTKCADKLRRLIPFKNLSNSLFQAMQISKTQEVTRILIPGKEGGDIVAASHILFIQAEGSYTRIHIDDGRELYSSKNLKHYESVLEGTGLFIRVHKSYIVNKEHIIKIVKTAPAKLVLSTKTEIPISEQIKDALYSLFS